MERVLTSDLGAHAGTRVRLAGWLHNHRRLSRHSFLVLRDGSGLVQVVVDGELQERLDGLLPETVLEIDGDAVAAAQAPGGVEVHARKVRVLSEPAAAPPVDLRPPRLREQLPHRLDHAAVALRHPAERAKLALAAASLTGYRATLDRLGFTEIQTPKLVASATEGGANVFEVDYFGRPAYLAQSPQLYKQVMVGVFERVYEVGPVFRAEPHETGRHLAEYVSLDAELGFVADHRTVMAVAREVVAGMVEGVGSHAVEAVELLGVELPEVPAAIPARLVGAANVRETALFPRDRNRLTP